jgi:hypothetical protein
VVGNILRGEALRIRFSPSAPETALSRQDYLERAAECLRIVFQTEDAASRMALSEMVRAWLALAEQAEKNVHPDLMHEAPPAAVSDVA